MLTNRYWVLNYWLYNVQGWRLNWHFECILWLIGHPRGYIQPFFLSRLLRTLPSPPRPLFLLLLSTYILTHHPAHQIWSRSSAALQASAPCNFQSLRKSWRATGLESLKTPLGRQADWFWYSFRAPQAIFLALCIRYIAGIHTVQYAVH